MGYAKIADDLSALGEVSHGSKPLPCDVLEELVYGSLAPS